MEHSSTLPSGNLLPCSYTDLVKLVEPFLIKPVVFHCCPNDCVVFRGKYIDAKVCPHCSSSRYKPNGKDAMKRYTYLPIGPRLVRMFGTDKLAQILQSHGSRTSNESTMLFDIQDSPIWKETYKKIFLGDRNGICLALNTDGVNPYKHNKVSYSMWPIMITLLNLPSHLRTSFNNIWLVGIIPPNGPKEPLTLDPYLEIVVDEILSLSNKKVYNAYTSAPLELKVHILLYVLDYPAIGKVFNTLGSGAYQGCMWCEIQGELLIIIVVYFSGICTFTS